jgi:hypothetical protein
MSIKKPRTTMKLQELMQHVTKRATKVYVRAKISKKPSTKKKK